MPFNAVQCAQLHNEIFRRGWEATGQSFDNAPFTPYWDHYRDHRDELTAITTVDVREFYQNAMVFSGERSPDDAWQNFFYFLLDLTPSWPEWAKWPVEGLNEARANRYILLYHATNLASHPSGLILDQDTGKALVTMSIFDPPLILGEAVAWQPLQTVLQSYLDMINSGKAYACDFQTHPLSRGFGDSDPQHPWKLRSYSDASVQATFDALRRLIRAIEARMPVSEGPADATGTITAPLGSLHGIEAASFRLPPDSFIHTITTTPISRDRRLRFIAPGISLPASDSAPTQPFTDLSQTWRHSMQAPKSPSLDIPEGEDPLYMPFLLFPATDAATAAAVTTTFAPNEHYPFTWPFTDVNPLPAGLWIDSAAPWAANPYEDASILILPFAFGGPPVQGQRHAKYNDGVKIGTPDGASTKFGLYQTYANPFVEQHRTQLHLILESWARMVEQGLWEVGADGVQGGVGKWREADASSAMAERYTAEVHW